MKKSKFTSLAMSPGEMLDRFTILVRKAHFDSDTYAKQVLTFKQVLNENGLPSDVIEMICRIQMFNTDIWNLESDIRKGKEGQLGNAEVGKRALQIRDINNKRIECVNKLNELFGDDRKEKKYEHASE